MPDRLLPAMAHDNETRTTSTQKKELEMPAFGNRNDDEDEDTTFDEVSAMADRLGLKGKGRMTYIDDHMGQLGYDVVQSRESYVRRASEDPDGQEQGTSRWGFGSAGRGRSGGRNQRGRGDDDDTF